MAAVDDAAATLAAVVNKVAQPSGRIIIAFLELIGKEYTGVNGDVASQLFL